MVLEAVLSRECCTSHILSSTLSLHAVFGFAAVISWVFHWSVEGKQQRGKQIHQHPWRAPHNLDLRWANRRKGLSSFALLILPSSGCLFKEVASC
eukprot:6394719-Amphidinium_carterae.1